MKTHLIYFILCFYVTNVLFGQDLVNVIQPTTYIYYQAGQQLTDSTVRYFLISRDSKYKSNSLTYLVDQNVPTGEVITFAVLDTSNEYSLITAADTLFHIPLHDGSSIIGSNGFECDFTLSDLTFFTKEGNVKWHLGYGDNFIINNTIKSIGLVQKEVVAVITEESEVIYINFEGEELFFLIPPPIYYNITYVNGNYYGTKSDMVFKLKEDFEILDSLPVNDITFFGRNDNNRLLLGTKAGLKIMDENLVIVGSNPLLSSVVSGTKTNDEIWVVNDQGLFELDTLLTIRQHFTPEPNEKMKYTCSFEDNVIATSEYDGLNHKDLVCRKYIPLNPTVLTSLDISIDNLYFPEKVIREIWNGFPYAFQFRFDSMGVLVRNQSEDTLYSCIVNCDWDADVYCLGYHHEWKFDSIYVLPHGQVVLQLGSFTTDVMYYGAGTPFCFWVDLPNGHPDIFPQNDNFCGNPEIINKIETPQKNYKIVMCPNPANEVLRIKLIEESTSFLEGSIYNSCGILVERRKLNDSQTEISVENYPGGLYILCLHDGSGNSESHLFTVIH